MNRPGYCTLQVRLNADCQARQLLSTSRKRSRSFLLQLILLSFRSGFEARGLEYFPRFRAIEAIYKTNVAPGDETGAAFARIELPAEANLAGDRYRLHPVITDASFRIAEAIFPDEDLEQIHLPFGISGFSCDHAASGNRLGKGERATTGPDTCSGP